MKRKNFFNSSLFYILVFFGIIGLTQLFANNAGPESTETVSTTEFVQYLEDDRLLIIYRCFAAAAQSRKTIFDEPSWHPGKPPRRRSGCGCRTSRS